MNTLKQVYEYFFAFTINFVFIILGGFFVCMGGEGGIQKNPHPRFMF